MDDLELQRAIVMTLGYSAQFSYPLTMEEVFLRLITPRAVESKKVEKELDALVKQKKVVKQGQYYFLSSCLLDVQMRIDREYRSSDKLDEAKEFVRLAKKIPWITAVAVTGSVAVRNAKVDDDVDFLIITQPNRLWLSRLCVIFIALYKKKRRSWGREEKNSWCFNLWLEEHSLTMPLKLHTAYGAYEICQTQWLFVKHQFIVRQYYFLNSWVKKYLFNYYKHVTEKGKSGTFVERSATISSFFTTLINKIAYFSQRIYMVPHITKEKVGYTFAFFHPRDTKALIYTKWRTILKTV